MTRKKDILVESPCPELLCGLCDDILNDPMQVHCSEDHMFCRSCLANYTKESCPSCLEPLDRTSFQLSKFVKRQISRLRARCVYHSLGCTWEGLLEDGHSQSCPHQSIHCPNSHRGCPEVIKFMDMEQHRTECLHELIACPNSSKQCQPFLRKDSNKHDSTCSSFQCLFSQQGCPFVGTLQAVGRHCEEYCGKLHERIRQLELECNYMKQQLEQQQQQQQQYPDTKNIVENIMNDTKPATQQDSFMDSSPDSSMDEMALFHQMFNNSYLSTTTAENNTKNTSSIQPTTIKHENLNSMPCIPLLTNSTKQHLQQPHKNGTGLSSSSSTLLSSLDTDTISAPPPPSSASAPKRSTNGKIIRYSKNKQFAHGALRMARQRSSSGSSLTTEAVLQALHIANKTNGGDEEMTIDASTGLASPVTTSSPTTTQSLYTSSHRRPSSSSSKPISSLPPSSSATGNTYSFKNLDDVTKFLEELPPIVEGSPFLSSPSSSPHHGRKPNKSGGGGGKSKSNTTDGLNKRQPKTPNHNNNNNNNNNKQYNTTTAMEITSDKNDQRSPTTPSRPMYVLASTLLSKHTQGH